jgi:hypothetical protein
MLLNTYIWSQTVAAAKAAASNNPAWTRAIDRADTEIRKSRYWAFDGSTLTIQSTTSKKMYRIEAGNHACEARGGICKHRACLRLMQRYTERLSAAPALARSADERQTLIDSIKTAWPKTWPPLAVELMARFRRNKLEMLDTDMLRRVRLAIAI